MQKPRFCLLIVLALLFAVLSGCGSTPSATQSQQGQTSSPNASQEKYPHFKGKNVTVLVPASPGGGMDTYGRLISKYLEEELGATVIVQNAPGSGGVIATNQLYRAKPDGMTMATMNIPGLIFLTELGQGEDIQFDLQEFNYVGRPVAEPSVLFVGKNSGIKSIEDLVGGKREFTVGFSGLASDDYYFTKLETDLLEIKMKPVPGFDGSAEINLAVVRGDIDAGQSSYSSARTLIESGEVIPILQLSKERLPELPDVPTVLEVVPEKNKGLISVVVDLLDLGRASWALPQGTPDEIVNEARSAFDTVMKNPELLEEAKQAERPINPMNGQELQKLVQDTLSSSELQTVLDFLR